MNHATGTSLVLSVLGDHASDIAEQTSVRAEGHDLSIGRAEHCDWVLQAQGVSRQHAVVRHLNGMYFIEDRSTNGMLLNGTPLRGGEPVALGDGDRLQLDTFDILVALETPADERAVATARRDGERTLQTLHVKRAGPRAAQTDLPVSSSLHTDPLSPMGVGSSASLIPGEAASATPLDPLAWFQTSTPLADDPPAAAEPSGHWNHASPMTDRFEPPHVDETPPPRTAAVLPENWDRTRSLFQMPAEVLAPLPAVVPPVHAPLPEAAPTVDAPSPVAAPNVEAPSPVGARPARDPLATASKVASAEPLTESRWEPTAQTTEPAAQATVHPTPTIEPLFALVLDGVMDVLRARAELKNGFRLPATLIQRRENNPLKFAPTGTEALARVLAAPNEAFLSGEAAIVDAMDDIRQHQVALLAGVRAAFDDLIAQFDPARFEEGETHRPRFGFGPAKGPWERYRAHFQGLAADPEERFRRLFGDEFARAYEDQLARAKRDGSDRNRP